MLQSIRDKSQGWIAWTVIIILCLAFVVWGFSSYFHLGKSDVIATVNGHKITQMRLHQVYQRLHRKEEMRLGADDKLNRLSDQALRQRAFDTLLSEQVLSQALHERGLRISEKQINAVIEQIPAFQDNGHFSQDRYLDVLRTQGMSPRQFAESIRMQFINNQLRAVFQDGSFVLPSELNEFMSLGLQTRDIRYGEILASQFKSDIAISDQAIKAYYNKHKDLFRLPEKVRLSYVELSLDNLAKKENVSDAEIKQYYHNHLDQYTLPARWKVQHIVFTLPKKANKTEQDKSDKAVLATAQSVFQQLQKGASFADMAKRYSGDPLTAKKGGDLSWITQGSLGAAFDKAILALKPGQVSQPFKTKYGYEIVRLNQVKSKQVKPLTQFRAHIHKQIAEQKAAEEFSRLSEELANISYENPDNLTKASQALELPIHTTGWIHKDDTTVTGITSHPSVLTAAFSEEVLGGGNNSDLITLNNKTAIVLRVREHVAKTLKPLAQVEPVIKVGILKAKLSEKAISVGEKALRALNRGVRMDKVTKQYHLNWIHIPNLSRNDSHLDATITDYAFTLPIPAAHKQSSYGGVSLESGNYALVQLLAVKPGELSGKKAKIQKHLFRQQLLNLIANYDYEQFVKGLLQGASIKIKDKRFKNNLVNSQ